MYGCAAASRAWSLHFRGFIRRLGFVLMRADQCMQIKAEDDRKLHQCMSTHTGDLLIVGEDPMRSMELLAENFDIRHAEENPGTHLSLQ